VTNLDAVSAWRASNSSWGVWCTDAGAWSADFERKYAREVERLGYSSLWIPENPSSKESLVHAGLLLSMTETLSIGTGITSVWARDAVAAHNGAQALAEAYDGRFVLGLGVSHRVLNAARGYEYATPYTTMSEYLSALSTATYDAPQATTAMPVVIGALRDKMMALGAEKADGAHTYMVTTEHTAHARSVLGAQPLLIVEQSYVLADDEVEARRLARAHLSWYLGQPNYQSSLQGQGFSESDIANGGSDHLVDSLVAWGSADEVEARVSAHLAAGADQVLLHPVFGTPDEQIDALRTMATRLSLTPR